MQCGSVCGAHQIEYTEHLNRNCVGFYFCSDYVIMHSWVICLPVWLSNTLNLLFFIYFIGQNMRVETSVTVSCNFEFFNGNWIEIVSIMPTWMLISKMVADFQQSISCFLFPTWRICSRLGCNCQKCLFLGNLSYLMLVYNILFLRLWFSYYVVSYKIAPEWIERQQCYCDFEVHPFFRSYREWNIQFCQNDLLLLFFIVNITRDSKTHKSYLILRQS